MQLPARLFLAVWDRPVPALRPPHRLSELWGGGFACLPLLQAWTRTTSAWLRLPSCVPPQVQTLHAWYGNINPFPIGYAFRPHLRGRLTLGGRTFPRKPWAFGDTNSHRVYRYSCRHSHFHELHRPSRVLLQRWWNAPLPTSLMQSIRVIPRFR